MLLFATYNCGIPPQSLLFSVIDVALTFSKTHLVGSPPSILLNESFKYFRNEIFTGHFGINPVKLFHETSKYSRSFKATMDEGTIPLEEFPCKYRDSKFNQFPIFDGISPYK